MYILTPPLHYTESEAHVQGLKLSIFRKGASLRKFYNIGPSWARRTVLTINLCTFMEIKWMKNALEISVPNYVTIM